MGGALGALLRWIVGETVPFEMDFPLPTLIINVTGAGLLALLLVKERKSWQRPLLGTGLLGGFTTFSAVTAQLHFFLGDGNFLISAGYLVITVILSLIVVSLILRKR